MTIAEVLLRIGCTVIAWLIMFTHCLWLTIVNQVGCESDGDAMWRLLLGFMPATLLFGLFLNASRKVGAVHENLRWGVVPLLLLIPLSLKAIWPTYIHATRNGLAICGETTTSLTEATVATTPASWHPYWAPLQFFMLTYIAVMAWRAWRVEAPAS